MTLSELLAEARANGLSHVLVHGDPTPLDDWLPQAQDFTWASTVLASEERDPVTDNYHVWSFVTPAEAAQIEATNKEQRRRK